MNAFDMDRAMPLSATHLQGSPAVALRTPGSQTAAKRQMQGLFMQKANSAMVTMQPAANDK